MVRVLIVDDQESFRSAARMVVSLTPGFEVAGEAEDGDRGVELAFDLMPDLVLMDISMPGTDGLEATRLIADGDGPPVVVLSTYEAAEYAERALHAGAIGFFSKAEFGPEVLVQSWEKAG